MQKKLNISIKKLDTQDIIDNCNEISNLLKQSYDISFPDLEIEENYFEDRVKELVEYVSKEKALIYGAFNKVIIGIIWCYTREFLKEKRLHVNHFVVNKDSRRLGVGGMLINEVEKYAKKNDIKSIDLMVTENSPSVEFYKHNGFNIERYQMIKRCESIDD